MSDTLTIDDTFIEQLADWSEPKRVHTTYGPRDLRKAMPEERFWKAWRSMKSELKQAGISCGTDRVGKWEALWWREVSQAEKDEMSAAIEESKATDAAINVPAPIGLDYLPYQIGGIAYASKRDAVLIGDEMGLGKTIQAIGVINYDESIKRVLVICPASLRLNWKRELDKWLIDDFTTAVVSGGKKTDFPTFSKLPRRADRYVVIINYDIVKKHADELRKFEWDAMIVDEAHYLKNPKAQRTKYVIGHKARKQDAFIDPIPAKRKIFLTGTPIVNRPVELWPIINYLAPNVFPNFFRYAKRYCAAKHNGYGWDFTGASNLDELQRTLRSQFMIRRLKSDVLTELPAKRRQVIELPANGAAAVVRREREAWERKERDIEELRARVELAKASEDPRVYAEAVARLRVRVVAAFEEMSQLRHETAIAKVPHVIEHLTDAIEAGGKVICFTWHVDVLKAIKEAFGDAAVVLYGETPMQQRDDAVQRFQNDESVRLFIGQIKAAGVGLTLTASSHVVFAELDWVPGNVTQAEDRAHRIGQTDSVLVQHLVLEDSLDATMAHTLVAKQIVIDRALDDDAPERQYPSPPVREEAASADTTRDELGEIAEKLTDDQIAAVHSALRYLADYDYDHAREKNDVGFNALDTYIGADLAASSSLTPRQAALGQKICRKYKRQIPDDVYDAIYTD